METAEAFLVAVATVRDGPMSGLEWRGRMTEFAASINSISGRHPDPADESMSPHPTDVLIKKRNEDSE